MTKIDSFLTFMLLIHSLFRPYYAQKLQFSIWFAFAFESMFKSPWKVEYFSKICLSVYSTWGI